VIVNVGQLATVSRWPMCQSVALASCVLTMICPFLVGQAPWMRRCAQKSVRHTRGMAP